MKEVRRGQLKSLKTVQSLKEDWFRKQTSPQPGELRIDSTAPAFALQKIIVVVLIQNLMYNI